MTNADANKVILLALLRGCEFTYDDYGHPERAMARMYWTAPLPSPDGRRAYGYTQAGCARNWHKMMNGDM